MKAAAATLAKPEPTWDVAELFPPQGTWTVDAYFELADSTNRLVEFNDGHIEVLELPDQVHQFVLQAIYGQLSAFLKRDRAGTAITAPFSIRVGPRLFREPDVAVMLSKHDARRSNEFWVGADLVVEIVSKGKRARERDEVTKRREYAKAGIPEYWIVSPKDRSVLVLTLNKRKRAYVEHARVTAGECLESRVLAGFALDTAAVFSS